MKALDVACPCCGAKPGQRCMVNPGAYRHLLKFKTPHEKRIRAAEAREKEENRG